MNAIALTICYSPLLSVQVKSITASYNGISSATKMWAVLRGDLIGGWAFLRGNLIGGVGFPEERPYRRGELS